MIKKIKIRMVVMVVMLVVAVFIFSVFSGIITESAIGDENYYDYSKEKAQGEQPDSQDIPGLNRSEDRNRFKDS